jgi:putative ABC transport system substrate-binding protein
VANWRRSAAAFGTLFAAVALLSAPLAAQAQQPAKVPRIGFLITGSPESPEARFSFDPFRQGLRERGYVEGRNILIEYRGAEGRIERLPGLAAELVGLKVDLIVAVATPAARAARQATTTIPIVALAMGDPVGDGLVASLARPGGNLTGTTFLGPKLVPKHLELLKEALPRISLVAVLWHPGAFAESTARDTMQEAQASAKTLGVRLHFAPVRDPDEFEAAFSAMTRARPDALLVFPSPMFFAERRRIVALAAQHRLPAVFNSRQAVELGGLIGYGASLFELGRHTATFVDKILKGARPGDLPVEQPTKFELVINQKSAKSLGLTIPPSLLFRADHVIE